MRWIIWVEDSENEHIYHTETWLLTKMMMREETHKLIFTIPISEPLPTQYFVRAINDSWVEVTHQNGANATAPISLRPKRDALFHACIPQPQSKPRTLAKSLLFC